MKLEAQALARRGFAVFPCRERGKEPAIEKGVHAATRDPFVIASMFPNNHARNIGVACGRVSGCIVLDFDSEMACLEFRNKFGFEATDTVAARTAKGFHLFFRYPALAEGERIKNKVRILDFVDVRSDGGYVLVAPSVHPSGTVYQWEGARSPFDHAMLELPAEALALLVSKPEPERPKVEVATLLPPSSRELDAFQRYSEGALRGELERLVNVGQGGRNHALNKAALKLAGYVDARGLEETRVVDSLTEAATAIGLERDEIRKTIASAFSAARRTGAAEQVAARYQESRRNSGQEKGGGGAVHGVGGNGPARADEPGNRVSLGEWEAEGSDPGSGVGGATGRGGAQVSVPAAGRGDAGARAVDDPARGLRAHGAGGGGGAGQGEAGGAGAGDGGASYELSDFSDTGIANAIGDTSALRLCFVPKLRTWYRYTGTVWEPDPGHEVGAWSEVSRFARYAAAHLEAPGPEAGEGAAEAFQAAKKRVSSLRNAPQIERVVRCMRRTQALARPLSAFDQHPFLLACQNGVVDLRSGELRSPDPALLLSKAIPGAYDPGAPAPTWERFLSEATQGNAELLAFLQRAAGYTITGDVREHCLFFLHGPGRNGKGTFVRALQRLLGPDFVEKLETAAIVTGRNGETPRERVAANLPGVRLAIGDEVGAGKLNVAFLKELTGGDTLRARKLYAESQLFDPTAKLWLQGNALPLPPNVDKAIRERVLRIRFDFDATRAGVDKDLEQKLKAEAPGILAWAVRGTQLWLEQGLQPPACVRDDSEEYLDGGDWLSEFVDDALDLDPEHSASVKNVWSSYLSWCEDGKRKPQVFQPGALSNLLISLPGIRRKRTKAERMLTGLRVRGAYLDGAGATPEGASDDVPF